MPITKGAIRKERADKKKAEVNLVIKDAYKKVVKLFRKKPSLKTLTEAFRFLDRASKKKVIHTKKADRLKSRLSKLLPSKKASK
jgi:ribosomal protein S20